MISLFPFQEKAAAQLKSGSILCGGVGSGKTVTSLEYYRKKEFPKDLYVITTAKKRDTRDWENEIKAFDFSKINFFVDSWNNIGKYIKIRNSFFIFDEQRVVGSGAWTISFLKIVKNNTWVLLSATPADNWMDYVPLFIANGFFKNRSEFLREHVVYNSFAKYPKVEKYLGVEKLKTLKSLITMNMEERISLNKEYVDIKVGFDKDKFDAVFKKRWNVFKNKPIKNISELFFVMKKVVNSDPSRIEELRKLLSLHQKIILFYNFDYELEILKNSKFENDIEISEYNGHKHEPIPKTKRWLYLVQYNSGAEGWNCVETNVIVFYSLNYSFRITTQAAGRIDRLNTKYKNLYYYFLKSESLIDKAIEKALKEKRKFNQKEIKFVSA